MPSGATSDSLTLIVPPRGVFRGSHGILTFPIVWVIITIVLTGVFSFVLFPPPQPQPGQQGGLVIFALVGGCFGLAILGMWAIAVLLVATAIDRGRRRAIIDIVAPATQDAAVLITIKRLFKTEQHQWLTADLASIKAAISDEQVDEKIFYEVRIQPKEGNPESFFSGRPKEEVEWIAAVLRAATSVPAGEKKEPAS